MATVINPVERVTIRGAEIQVQEMAWPDAMEFLEKLSGHFSRFVNAQGQVVFDTAEIGGLIAGTRELAELLVLRSTGRERAWLDDLKPREVLALLEAAIPLNLSPQVLNLGKQVAGRVQAALGITPAASSGASSTDSSRTGSA